VWLASQVSSTGYVSSYGSPSLSDTTLTVIALAAAGNESNVAHRALTYLESHVAAFVTVDGHDGPGQLATLILDAHVLGVKPTTFGGTNLVARLLKTMRTSGADAGLFGVQDPTYDGAYRQGLALTALVAAGVKKSEYTSAIGWLQRQECSYGGWESYRASTTTPCTATDADTYSGADTNSTALAVEGLAAVHGTIHHSPIAYLRALQSSTGGWGYYGGSADPDSTALVIQALLSLHVSPSGAQFRKGVKDPVSALLSFQLSNGALYYPIQGSPNAANGLATEQGVPALAKKTFPF
jgi:hypothetical protein